MKFWCVGFGGDKFLIPYLRYPYWPVFLGDCSGFVFMIFLIVFDSEIVVNVLDLYMLICEMFWLLQAVQFSIAFATVFEFEFVPISCVCKLIVSYVVRLVDEHCRLWLKVLNLKVWCQYVLCQLLLQLLFNLLAKLIVNNAIFWVK